MSAGAAGATASLNEADPRFFRFFSLARLIRQDGIQSFCRETPLVMIKAVSVKVPAVLTASLEIRLSVAESLLIGFLRA